jgi:cell wall assembly regulator SMI1
MTLPIKAPGDTMSAKIEDAESPLTEAEIAKVEQTLNTLFPEDYRAFLAQFNGGRPEPDGFKIIWRADQAGADDWRTSSMSWFYSIGEQRTGNLVRMNKITFDKRLPKGTMTVASDAGGNQILLGLAAPYQGQILFWVKDLETADDAEPTFDNVGFIADSFKDFVENKLN